MLARTRSCLSIVVPVLAVCAQIRVTDLSSDQKAVMLVVVAKQVLLLIFAAALPLGFSPKICATIFGAEAAIFAKIASDSAARPAEFSAEVRFVRACVTATWSVMASVGAFKVLRRSAPEYTWPLVRLTIGFTCCIRFAASLLLRFCVASATPDSYLPGQQPFVSSLGTSLGTLYVVVVCLAPENRLRLSSWTGLAQLRVNLSGVPSGVLGRERRAVEALHLAERRAAHWAGPGVVAESVGRTLSSGSGGRSAAAAAPAAVGVAGAEAEVAGEAAADLAWSSSSSSEGTVEPSEGTFCTDSAASTAMIDDVYDRPLNAAQAVGGMLW